MHYYTIKQIMIIATVSANAGVENYQDPYRPNPCGDRPSSMTSKPCLSPEPPGAVKSPSTQDSSIRASGDGRIFKVHGWVCEQLGLGITAFRTDGMLKGRSGG